MPPSILRTAAAGLGFGLAAWMPAATLDNGLVRAELADNGSLTVTDRTGRRSIALGDAPFHLLMKDGRTLASSTFAPSATATLPGAMERTFDNESVGARVRWRAELRSGSRYVRLAAVITNTGHGDLAWSEIELLDFALPGAEPVGEVNGSPIAAGAAFFGVEHPLALNRVDHGRVRAGLPRLLPLRPGESQTVSAIVGFTDPGQLRRGFLAYLERERSRPYRPFLHESTWYDIGYFNTFGEADLLTEIRQMGTELAGKRHVKLDCFQLDDGWDDPRSLWEFNAGFPQGLKQARPAAGQWGASVGLWLSPWGGYRNPKKLRLQYGAAQGFETREGSFSLAGPRYFQRFRDRCLAAIRGDGVNYFKFDGIGAKKNGEIDPASERDFEAMLGLIRELRAARPDLYVNLTTGTWPSPFWLRDVESIWRGGEDTELAGVGTTVQRWMTYRDGETFHNVVQRAPLFPLNSLMLHGIILARRAENHLSADPGDDFASQVWAFMGSGTQLQELFLTPEILSPKNWDDLAAAARWSRANADILKDTHWIGGDPRKLEPYGWASWAPRKGIIVLRNPSDQPATFDLDPAKAFELPPGISNHFTISQRWPRSSTSPTPLHLPPFALLVLEAHPEP